MAEIFFAEEIEPEEEDEELQQLGALFEVLDINQIDVENFNELQNKDVQNEAAVHSSTDDSESEELEDESCSGLVKKVKAYGYNFAQKLFCVIQNYVVVKTSPGNNQRTLCQLCYCLHQYPFPNYSHFQVNTHMRRKLHWAKEELTCFVCGRDLFQIINPRLCLICNKSNSMEVDLNSMLPEVWL
jgi:uncharacterized protein involved in tolerance to divalent cations